MNAEVFAKWLDRQGYSVIRTSSSYWFDAGPRVYQAFPYHWVIRPTEDELFRLLQERQGIALRYSTPLPSTAGCISYHTICNECSYALNTLERQARQNVRIGLRNCRIEQVSLERYAEEGWVLEMDTAARQGRRIKMGKEAWRRRCLTATDLPGFEAWGALVNGVLVASLLTFQMVDCCEMISFQSHRDYLKARVNNALIFVVTQTMLNRNGIRSVFHGLHSLDAPASVDEFKLRMGYTAKPVRQRIIFHRHLKPLANNIIHKILIYLLDKDPGNQIIAKAEGFLRFHLQGERPLNEQDWPEVLMEYKQALLKGLIWEEGILA